MTEAAVLPTDKVSEMFTAAWRELSKEATPRPDWFDAVAAREFALVAWGISTPQLFDEVPFLEGAHFAIVKLGRVWDMARGCASAGETPTISTMAAGAKVSSRDLLEWVMRGGDLGITRINARDYAEEIVKSYHASVIASTAKAAMANSGKANVSAITEAAENARAELSRLDVSGHGARSISAASFDLLGTTDARMASGDVGGARTGLSDLDDLMGGLKAGNLYIIAGRPGMGKSVLAGSIARQTAKAGNGVFFGSLELAADMQAARFLADEALDLPGGPIAYEDILRGTLRREQRERLEIAAGRTVDYPLIISDRTNVTVSEIRGMVKDAGRELRRLNATVNVVVLDYLKFIKATDRYAGQRVNEVGEITGSLKGMAKELGVAVVLVCQLNRQNEQREDKRPQLADLRESGDIEQDADAVLFVYRDEYYARRETDELKRIERLEKTRNVLEILVEKNRHGRTDTVRAWCDVSTSSVRDLEWRR